MDHLLDKATEDLANNPVSGLKGEILRQEEDQNVRSSTLTKALQKSHKKISDGRRKVSVLQQVTGEILADVQTLKNTTGGQLKSISNEITSLQRSASSAHEQFVENDEEIRSSTGQNAVLDRRQSDALNGNIALYLETPSVAIPVADWDAAPAGTLVKEFEALLCAEYPGSNNYTTRHPHIWAGMDTETGLTPVITPSESVADPQVAAPTVTWKVDATKTPRFVGGVCRLVATLNTDAGATKNHQAGTKSTGQFTCVAKANLIDGEIVTLPDALGVSMDLEFDVTGDGVVAGNIRADISGATTATEVAVIARDAINAETGLAMTATATGADVDLIQDDALAAGDTDITTTVVDGGFVLTDFTGGVDRDSVSVDVQVAADDKLHGFTVTKLTKTYYAI